MLTLRLEYLTGRSVAADPRDTERPEWPPHPGRLFMAMAAAYFECLESGETGDPERRALEWLERLPPPHLDVTETAERPARPTFVPVNDVAVAKDKGGDLTTIQGALRRKRAERSFAVAIPHRPVVYFYWPQVEGVDLHRDALQRVCDRTTRVGHASSLVSLAVVDRPTNLACEWQPVPMGGRQLRVAATGTLALLEQNFMPVQDWLDERIALAAQIDDPSLSKKERSGLCKKLSMHEKQIPVHPRPELSRWSRYAARRDEGKESAGSCYSRDLVVLKQTEGERWSLAQCLQLSMALRSAAFGQSPEQPPPEWLSGHQRDGAASRMPHLAIVPLAFVGTKHADGHGLGMALVVPRTIPLDERYRTLGPLVADQETGENRSIHLYAGNALDHRFELDDSLKTAQALRAETWTRPSNHWASVTPVVLDRFPKANRNTRRERWESQAAEIIARSCERIGLPRPMAVYVNNVPWVTGAPLASQFSPIPSRSGKPQRFHVHVRMVFAEPVEGPVLLGAGRHFGYGFCRPLKNLETDRHA